MRSANANTRECQNQRSDALLGALRVWPGNLMKGMRMFCLNCGREAKEGQAFCGNCGSKLPVASDSVSSTSPLPKRLRPFRRRRHLPSRLRPRMSPCPPVPLRLRRGRSPRPPHLSRRPQPRLAQHLRLAQRLRPRPPSRPCPHPPVFRPQLRRRLLLRLLFRIPLRPQHLVHP